MGVRVKIIQIACKNSIKRNLFWEESQEQHCRERGAHGGRDVEHEFAGRGDVEVSWQDGRVQLNLKLS